MIDALEKKIQRKLPKKPSKLRTFRNYLYEDIIYEQNNAKIKSLLNSPKNQSY